MSDAVIRERGYAAYSGPRHPERAWLVLARHTAGRVWAARGARRAILAAFVPALVMGVVVYGESRLGNLGNGALRIADLLSHAWGVLFPALIVALTAAGATLAEDRRAGALPFYFSRALPPRDYLFGRLLGVFLPLCLTVVAPTTGVALFRLALSRDPDGAIRALGATLVIASLGLAMSAVLAIAALLGGALTASRGAAQSFVGLSFVLPWMVAGIGGRVLDGPWLSLLSLPSLLEAIARPLLAEQTRLGDALGRLFDEAPMSGHSLPLWAAVLALVAIGAGGLLALRARVDRLARAGGGDA